jgi:hypothetical protein
LGMLGVIAWFARHLRGNLIWFLPAWWIAMSIAFTLCRLVWERVVQMVTRPTPPGLRNAPKPRYIGLPSIYDLWVSPLSAMNAN